MKRSVASSWDLALAGVMIPAFAAALTTEIVVLRLVLSIVCVLLLPGYLLTLVLYPFSSGTADPVVMRYRAPLLGRLALILPASLALAVIVGMALTYSIGLTTGSLGIAFVILDIILLGVAAVRRRRGENPLHDPLASAASFWTRAPLIGKAGAIGAALALLATGASVSYGLTTPGEEQYTEFYIMGWSLRGAPDLEATINSSVNLDFEIVNHEGTEQSYVVTLSLTNGQTTIRNPMRERFEANTTTLVGESTLVVPDESATKGNFTFQAPAKAGLYRVDVELWKGPASGDAYRSLQTWMLVRQS